MPRRKNAQWELNKAIAAGVIRDREHRRKVLSGFAFALLGMLAVGLWAIDDWLGENLWRFGLYWLACAGLCLFTMMFALLDALLAIREERDKIDR